jgi:hypothetical protein
MISQYLRDCRRVGTVLMLLVLAACGADDSAWTASSLDEAVREKPGVPLVLPQSLPDRYSFLGPGYIVTRADRVTLRSTDYRRSGPNLVVDLCLEPKGENECRTDNDPEIDRSTDQYSIVVRFQQSSEVPAEDGEFWTTVPLVLRPTEALWLETD